jgi:hypothetical protein
MPRVLDKIEPRVNSLAEKGRKGVLNGTLSWDANSRKQPEVKTVPIRSDLAWILDPYAPVPPNWQELVNPTKQEGTEEKVTTEYDIDELEALFNDLDNEDLQTLARLLVKLDPLEMKDGGPRYDSDEIDLIGKLKDGIQGAELDEEDLIDEEDEEPLEHDEHEIVDLNEEDPALVQEQAVEANVSTVPSP